MALSVLEVTSALREGDEGVRQGAVQRLDLREPGALEVLLTAMADPSWRVRREAVERTRSGAFERARLVAAFVPLLGEPDDVGLRNAAIEAVVALGAAAIAPVEQALAARPPHRKILCDVLGRLGGAGSGEALLPLLDDEDANVGIASAEAIGRLQLRGPADPRDHALGRRLVATIEAIADQPAQAAAAFRAAALLDAVARRRVELPLSLVERLLRDPVTGTSALRALAAGSAPRERAGRERARALAIGRLTAPSCAHREAAILAVAALLDDQPLVLDAAARAAVTEALLEGTVEVQRAAAALLGAGADASAARPLLVAIEDPAIEPAAVEALGRLAARDLPGLAAVSAGLEASGRAAVYRAIARVPADGGLPGLTDALARALAAEDEDLAIVALETLGARGGAEAAGAIADALLAAEALGSDGHDRVVAARHALARLATRHPERVAETVRAREGAAFIALLGELGVAGDVQLLAEQLSAPEVDIRRAAAVALAALASRRVPLEPQVGERAIEAARTALVDESPGVRAAAAVALARLEAGRPATQGLAVEALLQAARDEDVRVRGAATRALVELADVAHRGQDLEVRDAIRRGLRALADGRDGLTAVPALEALLAQHDQADDARLLDALTGPDDERRKVALYGLAARPSLAVRGDLLRLAERALHDARWDMRRAAIAALGAVGAAGRPALVARRSVETDPMVRADLDRVLEPAGGAGA